MPTMDELIELLKRNEEIAAEFQAIETKILSVLDFNDFFEVLMGEIRNRFQIPYVWLTLIESDRTQDMIGLLKTSEILDTNLTLISPDNFFALVPNITRPLLVNEDLKPFYRLLPFPREVLIQSMAISPITFEGDIIGSLNQADFSPARFSPDTDPILLEQLALKVSLCLSNVVAHEKLKFLAYHDPLTGLLNRRVMESVLNREFTRSQRYDSPLSVVFMDVDDFKKTNDQFGHDTGDKLLIHLAELLCAVVRTSDVVARFAGDEFVIILPETTAAKASTFMERVRQHIQQQPLCVSGMRIPLSISFGISSNDNTAVESSEALLKMADQALYAMKTSQKIKHIKP